MISFYKFAGLTVSVESMYSDIHELCVDYQTNGADIDFSVRTVQSDIEFERRKSEREDILEGIPVRPFSDGYLETLAVYRKLAERLPLYNTVLFHGSCVAVDGEGYLFTAKSGTGKSTHVRLWRELLGSRAVMVNDDKPLIRVNSGDAVVFGTPWDGKHRLSSNISVSLKALCVLERSETNRIEPVSVSEACPMLLQQIYRPADPEALSMTLGLLDSLARSIKLYRLGCNMEPDAARTAYNAMK